MRNPHHEVLSKSYSEFTNGITNGTRGGFDVHVYYFQARLAGSSSLIIQTSNTRLSGQCGTSSFCKGAVGTDTEGVYAHQPETPGPSITDNPPVPELRIYRFWDRPIGPHPVAMFEVNLFTPAQFGAFIPWLVINRGPLSALVHPNTDKEGEDKRNHTQRATWLGERLPLDLSLFK